MPLVEDANALKMADFQKRFMPGLKIEQDMDIPTAFIEMHSAASMSNADLDTCFELIKSTSLEMYRLSTGGWKPTMKKKEMRYPDMKYFLVKTLSDGKVIGFISFMVTYEDGIEVIYIYEIHLTLPLQGKGVGRILMNAVEQIGKNIGLKKSMLTVFTANKSAIRFYTKLGYDKDEFSPGARVLRHRTADIDYEILSKRLRRN